MAITRVESDVYVAGNLRAQTLSIPALTVVNADVSASADVAASKLEQHKRVVYSQDSTTGATDGE